MGLLTMDLWIRDEFTVKLLADPSFVVSTFLWGFPLPILIGALAGLPAHHLAATRGWSTRATVLVIVGLSALLGAVAVVPWNFFGLLSATFTDHGQWDHLLR
ncbi:MAG: hypothetical protein M8467_10075 [Anaerolineae bacterium]|nr:hypothetical protein [Anaerolineae bacterium]